jgi:uncharacterized membrane protein YhdT
MANNAGDGRSDRRSAWHWLLIVPVVVPLVTALYNGRNPYFLGFPRFYWLQLAFIILGVGTTTLVYQMTKTRPAPVVVPEQAKPSEPTDPDGGEVA